MSRPGLHRRRSRQRRGGLAWAVGPGRAVWTASGPGDRRARGQGPRTYRPRPRPRRRACWPGAARARASPPSPSCAGRPGPPGSVRTGRRSSFPQSESTVSLTAESRLVPSAWNETDCAGEAPRPPAECPGPRKTGRGAGPARPCVRILVGPARSDAPPTLSHTRSVTQRTHMHTLTVTHTHSPSHTHTGGMARCRGLRTCALRPPFLYRGDHPSCLGVVRARGLRKGREEAVSRPGWARWPTCRERSRQHWRLRPSLWNELSCLWTRRGGGRW